VAVRVSDGDALARASAAADALQQAIAAKVDAHITVSVSLRHEPLDVYA
jgi:hypothetical protein